MTNVAIFVNAYKNIFRCIVYINEDALALLVNAKLSRHQYNLIRKSDPERFPSYTLLQLEKMKCYPNSESIKITSTSADVKLQALLDHTVERLLTVQETVLNILEDKDLENLCLVPFCFLSFDIKFVLSEFENSRIPSLD